MQYAIINFTQQTAQFYATFQAASEAITNYNVASDTVYIVDLLAHAIEQL